MSSSAASVVPSPSDILCEACGYTLNGLPADGNCPECGASVAVSTAESGRTLPEWEARRLYWATTAKVVFQTTLFYRTLRTRVEREQHLAAYAFALRHWLLAGFLMALASGMHYSLTGVSRLPAGFDMRVMLLFIWVTLVAGLAGFAAMMVTHLAAWLTAWEAGWRGYRLPREVVLRGLCYHAAHLLPVAASALAVVAGYRVLWTAGVLGHESVVAYLVVLSTVTVAGALYLFWTYWIGMRNMLFANA